MYSYAHISDLLDKVFDRVYDDGDRIVFVNETEKYVLEHHQNCCENVFIEDICGDLNDLVGSPLVESEEVSNCDLDPLDENDSSYTWTFYKFRTKKGCVTVRFYGTSNGYYSETADLYKLI